jgi:hypothetical protein
VAKGLLKRVILHLLEKFKPYARRNLHQIKKAPLMIAHKSKRMKTLCQRRSSSLSRKMRHRLRKMKTVNRKQAKSRGKMKKVKRKL